jgi:pimeloyl-ACP methyl ester carboxylesterase
MKDFKMMGRLSAMSMLLLLLSISVFGFSSCSKEKDLPQARTQTFVLVHGAFQAAYSWKQVKVLLENKGYKVVSVELPGLGTDMTAPAGVTLDTYRDKVVAAIKAEQGQIILVGHSMGGMVISAAAEAVPEKISRLIYVGAFVPKSGQSLMDIASADKESQLGPLLAPDSPVTIAIKDSSKITEVFCADATEAIKQALLNKYRPDPLIPFASPVALTAARFGATAKSYIRTTHDLAVGLALQNQMIKDASIADVHDIASSHCPHLSKPTELTVLLISISK